MYISFFLYKKNNTIIIIGVLKLHNSQGPAFCLGDSYLSTLTITIIPKSSLTATP
jgi:hypothetical protein